MKQVCIIILHFKNIKDTLACLNSVKNLVSKNIRIKIILIDNDAYSNIKLYKKYPSSYIKTYKNLGFAAAINIGVNKALLDKKTDYFLILNNDTILPKDLLQVLIKDNKDILSPVIKFKSLAGNWIYDYGGKINWDTGRTTHLEEPGLFKKYISRCNVDYVSGCCMLIKRKVFKKIGLFDEDFFFYFEDVDFCVRAKKAGLTISVSPKTFIYHKLGGSIGRWTSKAIYYNLKSNFIFINKHLGAKRIIGNFYLFLLFVKIIFNKILDYFKYL